MDLENELKLAKKAAIDAGEYLKNLENIQVLENKGKDIKLDADRAAEKIILNYLLNSSNYSILAEERGFFDKKTELVWYVDSLDGSLNFLRGIPNSAVSIALWDGQEPLLGVIYDFNRNDLYFGIVGKGAWLNDKEITVSNIEDKKRAIIASGIPVNSSYSDEDLLKVVKMFQNYKKARFLGSAALSLAYVAAGKTDVYAEDGIILWDVAAGLALVKAAGGYLKYEKLNDKNHYNVFASNNKIK
ncbi:inositol monophosphatase [Candidatus Pacearchaeota archaeon]|nr:inositol monophosphatase [Candidatus Pacearchaeota archaeon]